MLSTITAYLVWFGFVAVAVSDAKEHRIPNRYLLAIFAVCIVSKAFAPDAMDNLAWSFVAGVCFFCSAFALYLLRMMAPGDVKLIGVVGFWLGWGNLMSATVWIAVSSVLVGLFYAAVNSSEGRGSIKELLTKYSMITAYGRSGFETLQASDSVERKLRMPFGPIVVIGLAMNQYF